MSQDNKDIFYCTECKTEVAYGVPRCPNCNKKFNWTEIASFLGRRIPKKPKKER